MTAQRLRPTALALLAALLVALPHGADAASKKAKPKKETRAAKRDDAHTLVVLKTTLGDIVIRPFADKAPNTVKHFLDLASAGFYDGTVFHRVIPGFILQGGDPLSKNPARSGEWGTGFQTDAKGKPVTIPAEFNDVTHRRGTVSMARMLSDPNSASSQFFIVLKDAPALDRQWTAFGEVTSGMEVADRIAAASNPDTNDPRTGGTPRNPQKILKAELMPESAGQPKAEGKPGKP